MLRTNSPADVAATGYVQVDAGDGIILPLHMGGVDTGWRDMTDNLLYGWTTSSGGIFIRRVDERVMYAFKGLDGTAATSSACIGLQSGFMPDTFTGGSPAFFVRSQQPLDTEDPGGPTKDFWGSAGTGFMRLEIGQLTRTGTWLTVVLPAEAALPNMATLPGSPRST